MLIQILRNYACPGAFTEQDCDPDLKKGQKPLCKLRILVLAWLAAFAATGVAALGHAQAHPLSNDFGFKWFNISPAYIQYDAPVSSQWQAPVSAGAGNWYNQTKIKIYHPYTPEYFEIYFYNGSYPVNMGLGFVSVYSNTSTCILQGAWFPGACNKSNNPATTGQVYLNDTQSTDIYTKQRTAAHEIGHVFGLSHPDCSDGVLMSPTACWWPTAVPPTNGLTAHDIAHINNIYP